MSLTASKLRENLYKVLDEVLETGVAVEIRRRGKILKIVPAEPQSKLANLERRAYLRSDPEELVHLGLVRGVAPLIYLDTHVAAWLYAGALDLVPDSVREL